MTSRDPLRAFITPRALKNIFHSVTQSYCKHPRWLIRLSAEARDYFSVRESRNGTRRGHHDQAQVFVSTCMQRQLAAFVEQPSRCTFLAARDAVLRESPLPLLATELAELDKLLDQDQYQVLLDRLDTLPPSRVLSPHIHFLAAEAADALGNLADMELERCLFVITLRGLLATGDGSRANPYIVCHVSDEHDILLALGRQSSRQSLVTDADRLFDRIVCSDGREVWFDVTEILSRPKLTRRQRAAVPKRPRRRPSRLSR